MCAVAASAAKIEVTGLGLLGNRAAEQKIKLLLGAQSGATVNANAVEDAALVLVSGLTNEGYLEPVLTMKATLPDGQHVEHILNTTLDSPLARPFEASTVTLQLAKGHRFTLTEIIFRGLLAITEKEARSFFVGETALIPLASERIYSPGRLQSSASNLE